MAQEKVTRDLHVEVGSTLASFLPLLDTLISELKERVIEEERKPAQDAQEPIPYSFLRKVVEQGYPYLSKNPEEGAFLALYRDLSRLTDIRNKISALLKP